MNKLWECSEVGITPALALNEPCHEEPCLRSFRPGPTETGISVQPQKMSRGLKGYWVIALALVLRNARLSIDLYKNLSSVKCRSKEKGKNIC